jgi:flagellar motor switch protein FliN
MSDDHVSAGGVALDEHAAPADFQELRMGAGPAEEAGLASLYDLTMPVSIELGRTKMTVQEILSLGRGSVIQLERLAGEPMDVFVGDRRFAEGEVVVIGEQFGVRITRVLTPLNRETR